MTTTNFSSFQRYRSISHASTRVGGRVPPAWQMFVFPRPVPQPQVVRPQRHSKAGTSEWVRFDSSHSVTAAPHYPLNWIETVGTHHAAPIELDAPKRSVAESGSTGSTGARMGELLAEAAHDIRAPLATAKQVIDSVLERVRNGMPLEQRDLSLLAGASQRLSEANRWAEEILSERNLSHRKVVNVRRRFYPEQWRRSTQSLLESLAEAKNIRLQWIGWERSLPRMYLDPNLLSRVVMNLISNAVEASQPEGQVRIRVAWQNTVTQRLLIVIEDQGMGLDAQVMRQVNSSKPWPERTAGTPMAGIGLRTVKSLMESMGGTVSAQRGSQGGTLFRLALPVDDLRSLIRSWIVQNAAAAKPGQATRLLMHTIQTTDIDSSVVDRQLQSAAGMHNFVYRLADDQWLWLSLAHDRGDTQAEDVYSIARRLTEIGRRTNASARCSAEMLFSMSDLPFASLHGTSHAALRLPYLAELIMSQVDQLLNGRVPTIDTLFSAESVTGQERSGAEASLATSSAISSDAATRTISEIAKQWRVIHGKLEHLRSQNLTPAAIL